MTTDVLLECTCGSLQGRATQVSPKRGNRLVCMCDDCQSYAHWLGRADEVLDANGGTEVFQLTPSQLEIHQGADQIRCMRLSPKGLMRWHTGCCNTPIANTLRSPKVPFAGVATVLIRPTSEDGSLDAALGPVRARVNGRFGYGEQPANSHPRAPVGLIARSLGQFVTGWFRGAHTPSPFFDADTAAPVVEPVVVSLEERKRLLERCGPEPTG